MGGAYASRLIGTHDIRNGSIRGVDVHNGSLHGSDVGNGSLGLRDLNRYTQNRINQGLTGLATKVNYQVWQGGQGKALQSTSATCDAGTYALGGGYHVLGPTGDPYGKENITVVSSSPTDSQVGGDFEPDSWSVRGFNDGDGKYTITAYVICADAPAE
jgi:hypothetical protein